MPFKIKIVEVNTEEVRNGRNKYDKASVVYSFNGQNRTQNLMSFSNPGVFAKVKDLKPGDEVNVEVTKNDKGYNTWASVDKIDASASPPASATSGARTNVSTYETAEERKIRQLLIVKQSSITNAINYIKELNNEEPASVEYVLSIAQKFVDFVYGTDDQSDLFEQGNDLE